jgi:hypothetical protein
VSGEDETMYAMGTEVKVILMVCFGFAAPTSEETEVVIREVEGN